MAARPGVSEVRLGHERRRLAEAVGDLLDGVLEHEVDVGHLDRRLVREVQLVLAAACLTLAELDRHAGPGETTPDRAEHVLLLGRLQDVVVLDVRRVGREVAVAELVGLVERLLEEKELDLGSDHRDVPECCRLVDLGLQHATRRHLDGGSGVDVDEIAQHHRRLVDPREVAHGGFVDDTTHVAIALVVARPVEAGDRIVVEVAGDQVVAVLGALLVHDVEIEPAVGALADEAPGVVTEDGEHRVDRAVLDVGDELVVRDVGVLRHGVPLTRAWCRRP